MDSSYFLYFLKPCSLSMSGVRGTCFTCSGKAVGWLLAEGSSHRTELPCWLPMLLEKHCNQGLSGSICGCQGCARFSPLINALEPKRCRFRMQQLITCPICATPAQSHCAAAGSNVNTPRKGHGDPRVQTTSGSERVHTGEGCYMDLYSAQDKTTLWRQDAHLQHSQELVDGILQLKNCRVYRRARMQSSETGEESGTRLILRKVHGGPRRRQAMVARRCWTRLPSRPIHVQ